MSAALSCTAAPPPYAAHHGSRQADRRIEVQHASSLGQGSTVPLFTSVKCNRNPPDAGVALLARPQQLRHLPPQLLHLPADLRGAERWSRVGASKCAEEACNARPPGSTHRHACTSLLSAVHSRSKSQLPHTAICFLFLSSLIRPTPSRHCVLLRRRQGGQQIVSRQREKAGPSGRQQRRQRQRRAATQPGVPPTAPDRGARSRRR